MESTPSGNPQVQKQYEKKDWQANIRMIKFVVRLIERVAHAIGVTLYEMFPEPRNTAGAKRDEAENNADSYHDTVVQRDH